MTKQEAIEILEKHNLWRRDNNVPSKYEMQEPKVLGQAIDFAIKYMKDEKDAQRLSRKSNN